MTVFVVIALAAASASPPAQPQDFRPVSLADLVKAVGTNRDGLEDLDLTRHVADHALWVLDDMAVAARLRDDPEGALFVGWRRPGELWRSRFLDEQALAAVRSGADVRLGRVDGLRTMGGHLVLETLSPSSMVSSVVMTRDLAPAAFVAGSAKLALGAGALVIERAVLHAGARLEELAILDLATRRVTPLYPGTQATPARAAFVARLPRDAPFDVSISSLQQAGPAGTLTFTVTFSARPPTGAAAPVRADVTVTCRTNGDPGWTCVEGAARLE